MRRIICVVEWNRVTVWRLSKPHGGELILGTYWFFIAPHKLSMTRRVELSLLSPPISTKRSKAEHQLLAGRWVGGLGVKAKHIEPTLTNALLHP